MIMAKAIAPREGLECSSCHLLAEYKFVGKDKDDNVVNTYSCCSPICYEDSRIAAGGEEKGPEHTPNLTFGGTQ